MSPRPVLAIEAAGGASLGNCYSSMTYRITSQHPLPADKIAALRDLGLLGYGQEYCARYQHADGLVALPTVDKYGAMQAHVAPSGVDVVQGREFDESGRFVRSPGINPYSHKEYEPVEMPYYVYAVERRVDSSD